MHSPCGPLPPNTIASFQQGAADTQLSKTAAYVSTSLLLILTRLLPVERLHEPGARRWCSVDGSVNLHEVATGTLLSSLCEAGKPAKNAMHSSALEPLITTASHDGCVHVWDAERAEPRGSYRLHQVCLSPEQTVCICLHPGVVKGALEQPGAPALDASAWARCLAQSAARSQRGWPQLLSLSNLAAT